MADAQDAAGTLAVAATGAPAGIDVALQNNAGTIAATVSASCEVTPGARAIGLTVTDSGALSASAEFNVVVLGNDACAAPPTASFGAASRRVAENIGQVSLEVRLSRSATQDVSVPFTVGGTASAGTDYNLASGALTIAAGELSADIDLTIIDDTLDEPDETVIVTMGAPINAALGAQSVQTITIQDDDTALTLALEPADDQRGRGRGHGQPGGASERRRPTSLSRCNIAPSTAAPRPGSDYAATTGSLSFSPGSTSETIVLIARRRLQQRAERDLYRHTLRPRARDSRARRQAQP